jgi:Flp pilus assembly pilin Flp
VRKEISRFITDGSGAIAIEYTLIALLIGVMIIASFPIVANALGPLFERIANSFAQ